MSPRMLILLVVLVANAMFASRTPADEPPPLTTLSRPDVVSQVPERPYHVVRRGAVTMVVVNNEAVDDDVLPGHRAGYSGIARLSHEKRADHLFVPAYAGLNFEHIFDSPTTSSTGVTSWSCVPATCPSSPPNRWPPIR